MPSPNNNHPPTAPSSGYARVHDNQGNAYTVLVPSFPLDDYGPPFAPWDRHMTDWDTKSASAQFAREYAVAIQELQSAPQHIESESKSSAPKTSSSQIGTAGNISTISTSSPAKPEDASPPKA